jgi:hypothetical protein
MTIGDLKSSLESNRSTEIVEIHKEERKIKFDTDAGDEITLSTVGRLARSMVVETRLYHSDGNWTVEIV